MQDGAAPALDPQRQRGERRATPSSRPSPTRSTATTALLDGEIVTFDDRGRPSFERLQRRMHVQAVPEIARLSVEVPVVYVVFDLLWLDGHLTTGPPLLRTGAGC